MSIFYYLYLWICSLRIIRVCLPILRVPVTTSKLWQWGGSWGLFFCILIPIKKIFKTRWKDWSWVQDLFVYCFFMHKHLHHADARIHEHIYLHVNIDLKSFIKLFIGLRMFGGKTNYSFFFSWVNHNHGFKYRLITILYMS